MQLAGARSDQTRVDWVARSLKAIPAGQRILDVGAGELRLKAYCAHLSYVSQDICQYQGAGDDRGLQTARWDTSRVDIVSDITSIPVPDASFDVVLCSEVLEHLPEPVAAIREFSRVLRPGGTLLLTAPFCSLTHFAPYHFASGLNRYWYETHLPAMSFAVVEIRPNGNWFEFVGQELSRVRYVSAKYSSGVLGWLMLAASFPLRAILSLLSSADRGSEALLCFGFQVKALKVPAARKSSGARYEHALDAR
jgi:ubiquinone/menaquinone biosynthesis C-methylase UbiE